MTHVMIDMETWGVRPGSALRSLGAVVFDPKTGALGKTFYANIDDESCARAGLTQDQSTIDWWAQQSAEAREALAVNPRSLLEVLVDFRDWFEGVGGECVWSHGATFDAVLLESAYRALDAEPRRHQAGGDPDQPEASTAQDRHREWRRWRPAAPAGVSSGAA